MKSTSLFPGAILLFLICFSNGKVTGQSAIPAKEVTHYTQTWFSINNTFRFSERWGAVADYHVRKDDFFQTDYFYFLRFGGVYWINGKYPVIAGVAHLWLAPPAGKTTWSNENRIYEQWSTYTQTGKVGLLQRIRLEQRWRDQIINDEVVGNKQFSLRLRYLASFEFKVFKDPTKPSLVASDEVLVQFGESVVNNTFDQNRLFLGLKFPVNSRLSFDVGYMNVFQQKSSGYQYDNSDIFRLFFYYNVDFSDKKRELDHQENSE